MKKILSIFFATTLLFLTSCDFGSDNTAATPPPVTEPSDTSLPTKVDATAVESPQEVPVAELPNGSKKQDYASQGVSLSLSPGMTVEDLETFILVCSDQQVKDAQCFTLERFDIEPTLSGMKAVSLKGRPFYYSQNAVNGNQELEGYLKMGHQWFLVKAAHKTDPTWIFPYLAHVEVKETAL